MAKPVVSVADHPDGYRVVKFEIPGGVCTPGEFAEAVAEVAKQLPGERPVLINGRGPVWGYAMLVHAAHPTPCVGTFDPRMAAYVVVATHDGRYRVGSVIPDPEA